MREALLAFIKSVQAAVVSEQGFRHEFRLKMIDYPSLTFGYGYHSADKVVVWLDVDHEKVVTPEEAVDILLPKDAK